MPNIHHQMKSFAHFDYIKGQQKIRNLYLNEAMLVSIQHSIPLLGSVKKDVGALFEVLNT